MKNVRARIQQELSQTMTYAAETLTTCHQHFNMQHESRMISGDEQILQEPYQNLKIFITSVLTQQSPVLSSEYAAL
jgi:exonuclease VII large subunit